MQEKGGKIMVIDFNTYRKEKSLAIPYGEWVAIARKNQGMTQERLAEKIGCSQWKQGQSRSGQATPQI
jgi:ribosome-binding protein aMBF1 (putative translation factor)